MSRESDLMRRCAELAKLAKSARSVVAKALGDEASEGVVAICDEIMRRIGKALESPGGLAAMPLEEYYRILALADQARKKLEAARIGQKSDDEIDVDDDIDEDSGNDSGARWPSEMGPLPKPQKPKQPETEELKKAAAVDLTFKVSERLKGFDGPDAFMNAILPIRRRNRDSAVIQTPGAGD